MSKYTVELRWIVEQFSGMPSTELDSAIAKAYPQIFDFSFPIFDEEYRPVLCQKIIKNFYTREIGEETVGLWKLRLNQKLNLIMPYYNQLYKTEQLEYNPLFDVDLTTTHNGTTGSEDSRTTNESGKTTGERGEKFNSVEESNTNNTQTVEGTTSGSKNTKDSSTSSETEKTTRTENRTLSNNETGTNTGSSTDSRSGKTETDITAEESGTTGGTLQSTVTTSKQTSGQNQNATKESDTPQGPLTDWQADNYMSFGRVENGSSGGTEEGNTTQNDTTSGTSSGNSESHTVSTVSDTNTREAENKNVVNSSGSDNLTIDGTVTRNGSSSGSQEVSEAGEESRTTKDAGGATKGVESNSEGSESGTSEKDISTRGEANTTEDYITRVTGKNGGKSYAAMIMEYRDSLINIDKMIIDELEDCFMQIW